MSLSTLSSITSLSSSSSSSSSGNRSARSSRAGSRRASRDDIFVYALEEYVKVKEKEKLEGQPEKPKEAAAVVTTLAGQPHASVVQYAVHYSHASMHSRQSSANATPSPGVSSSSSSASVSSTSSSSLSHSVSSANVSLKSLLSFKLPYGICVDSARQLIYVADSEHHALKCYSSHSGSLLFVIGMMGRKGWRDGTASMHVSPIHPQSADKLFSAASTSTAAVLAAFDPPNNNVRFYYPFSLGIGRKGEIFVTDYKCHCIRKVEIKFNYPNQLAAPNTQQANVSTHARNSSANASASSSSASNSSANYAPAANSAPASSTFAPLMPVSASITVSTLAGGSTSASSNEAPVSAFSSPCAVAYDSLNNILYIADTYSHSIKYIRLADAERPEVNHANINIYTLSGHEHKADHLDGKLEHAAFHHPWGLALYYEEKEEGKKHPLLYVSDSGSHVIRCISLTERRVYTIAGQRGLHGHVDSNNSLNARFASPRALACDLQGNIFVADSLNHCVRIIKPNGVVSTVCGCPGISGYLDDVGIRAKFSCPYALSYCSATHALYVADTNNEVVRKITLPPLPSTNSTLFSPSISLHSVNSNSNPNTS